jgi:hypothetical protein
MAVFWVIAPCSLVEVCQCFKGPLLIALMMEAARTSETFVNFYQTTRRYNPEDSHLLFIISFAVSIIYINAEFCLSVWSFFISGLTSKPINHFRYFLGLPGRGISQSQGLYLYRKAWHIKTQTYIHISSEIRTHDISFRWSKTVGATDRVTPVKENEYQTHGGSELKHVF